MVYLMLKTLIILMFILLTSCTPKLVDVLPADIASFDLIEYRRGGGIGSAIIVAKDGVKVGDSLEIGELKIIGDYPFFNVRIRVLGYKQENVQ